MIKNLPLTSLRGVPLWCMSFTLFPLLLQAQLCPPNCRDLNLSIIQDTNGALVSKIFFDDALTNFPCAGPVQYALTTTSQARIGGGSSDDVGNEEYFLLSDVCNYLGQTLVLQISNSLGTCMSMLTFKEGPPIITGRSTTVYPNDPIVTDPTVLINNEPPALVAACEDSGIASYVADWPEVKMCDPGVQDTAKIIYREWTYTNKKGQRGSAFDTIIVLQFPMLDREHLYCTNQDTIYCNDAVGVGPYLIVETSPGSGLCDTIHLIQANYENGALTFDSQIAAPFGLQVHVDQQVFGHDCEEIYRVMVDIKQLCPGGENGAPCTVPPDNDIEQVDPQGTYWRCEFWLYNLDTLPPTAYCLLDNFADELILQPDSTEGHCFDTPTSPSDTTQQPIIVLNAGEHDCSALLYLPEICVEDDWSGVAQVKASITGVGAYALSTVDTCTDGHYRFGTDALVNLAFRESPYQIVYELYDSCHNVDTIYCYVILKDRTRPVAVSDKGVSVDLAGALVDSTLTKKIWVEATTFDEGSWDNCGIGLMLARRTDWYEACMELCDTTQLLCTHHDLEIRKAYLDHGSPVEHHYAETMKWLANDSTLCYAQLLNGWMFDLTYYGTIACDTTHALSREEFTSILLEEDCDLGLDLQLKSPFNCQAGQADLEQVITHASQIGGGWSTSVPFDCNDACQNVTVELLVMDYWCNWSKTWSEVWVEDKGPLDVIQDVIDVEMSCKSYRQATYPLTGEIHPVSLEDIVLSAEGGDQDALEALNDILGSYEKAWLGKDGKYYGDNGNVIEGSIAFYDSTCVCDSDTFQVKVEDEHLGLIWKDSIVTSCSYEVDSLTFDRGIIRVNCAQNVFCEQDVWADFDHCGQGIIYRKFRIWQGCPSPYGGHVADTITRIQRIYVGNACPLNAGMFTLPEEVEIFSCGIMYDPDAPGQVVGAADPDSTGRPEYLFDDDCRIVGVAHTDKVFRIVGGDAGCYKILRTWYFADWCTHGEAGPNWWLDDEVVLDTFVQKILVRDTLPAVCLITGPVEDGGLISAQGCTYDFSARVDVMDACGVVDFYWELRRSQGETVATGNGDLNSMEIDEFIVEAEGLIDGMYQLKVRITDECQNESYCSYSFEVEALKKPSPVCITSMTLELVPMDLDGDGTLDTAMATIWANEFDVSSRAPCGADDEDLKFFMELDTPDNAGVGTLDTLVDLDSMVLGCDQLGLNIVRLWVLSPTGSADFCDVLLIVQDNNSICPEVMTAMVTVSGTVMTEDSQSVEDVAIMAMGSETGARDAITPTAGTYEFLFNEGEDVMITASKDGDDRNGVTTEDLLVYFSHASGGALTDEPYKLISGDVNLDGTLDAVDIIEIRNLVLLNIDSFSAVDSWRFARADYEFVSNPEQEMLDEQLEKITTQSNDGIGAQDYVAIKMGDANNSRITSARDGKPFVFSINEEQLLPGHQLQVPIFARDLNKLAAYQFTLSFDVDRLELIKVKPSDNAHLSHFHLGLHKIDEGRLLCSWINEGWEMAGDELPIFTLEFEVSAAGVLSDAMTMADTYLEPEVYYEDFTKAPLALKINLPAEQIGISQNYPNPWHESTRVDIELPHASELVIEVRDVSGRLIYQDEREASKGVHSYEFEKRDIGMKGIYYYTVSTKEFTKTGKMILLD